MPAALAAGSTSNHGIAMVAFGQHAIPDVEILGREFEGIYRVGQKVSLLIFAITLSTTSQFS